MLDKNNDPFFAPPSENHSGVIVNKNAKMPERDRLQLNQKKSDMPSNGKKINLGHYPNRETQ